jgi:thiol:disulfide interchange protein
MEEVKNNTGQNLGIAALITAVITFVLAVIPCVGLIAIIPGIIAIVLASVGLSQASRTDSPRGVLIAGLIIAIVASLISFSQIFVAGKIAQKAEKWPNNIQNIINDVQDNVTKELQDNNVSIKVESDGNKVEINTNVNKKDKEQKLEDLEGESTHKSDSIQKRDSVQINVVVKKKK